ncbi:MAG: 7-carboxy-7-deazaguanine synthase QueE [Promethearchaeota archaeon]
MRYYIEEIFDSIQGEGILAGTPATFIRLAGCNLNCDWCDTKYSWHQKKEKLKNIDYIVGKINQKTIIITGGEPTVQNLKPLIKNIRDKFIKVKNLKICIETNGTNPIDGDVDWITCSPKPKSKYIVKCTPNELKYVVDNNFSINVIPDKYKYKIPIWLQPQWFDLQTSLNKSIELVLKYDFLRLGFQLHKFYNIK